MRLRPNEFCPIHRSTSCCGRELKPRPRLIRLGVQRIEDPHHPTWISGSAVRLERVANCANCREKVSHLSC